MTDVLQISQSFDCRCSLLRCLKNFPLCLDSEFFHCFLEPLFASPNPDVTLQWLVELNKGSIEIVEHHPKGLLDAFPFSDSKMNDLGVGTVQSSESSVTTLGRAIWDSCVGTFIHWPTCSSRTFFFANLFLCHFRNTFFKACICSRTHRSRKHLKLKQRPFALCLVCSVDLPQTTGES